MSYSYIQVNKLCVLQGEPIAESAWEPFAIMFQEYHQFTSESVLTLMPDKVSHASISVMVHILWTFCSFLLVAALCGNLKTRFIVQEYEDSVNTLEEILDK